MCPNLELRAVCLSFRRMNCYTKFCEVFRGICFAPQVPDFDATVNFNNQMLENVFLEYKLIDFSSTHQISITVDSEEVFEMQCMGSGNACRATNTRIKFFDYRTLFVFDGQNSI